MQHHIVVLVTTVGRTNDAVVDGDGRTRLTAQNRVTCLDTIAEQAVIADDHRGTAATSIDLADFAGGAHAIVITGGARRWRVTHTCRNITGVHRARVAIVHDHRRAATAAGRVADVSSGAAITIVAAHAWCRRVGDAGSRIACVRCTRIAVVSRLSGRHAGTGHARVGRARVAVVAGRGRDRARHAQCHVVPLAVDHIVLVLDAIAIIVHSIAGGVVGRWRRRCHAVIHGGAVLAGEGTAGPAGAYATGRGGLDEVFVHACIAVVVDPVTGRVIRRGAGPATVRRTLVIAVRRPIAIGVGIRVATTASTGSGLVGISRTLVIAVRYPVTIAVDIGHPAAACPGNSLPPVVWTAIVAVRRAIHVAVRIRDTATTGSPRDFASICGTAVIAVRRPIAITIGVGRAAPADPGNALGRIGGAFIAAIRRPVSVRIQDHILAPKRIATAVGGTRVTIVTVGRLEDTRPVGATVRRAGTAVLAWADDLRAIDAARNATRFADGLEILVQLAIAVVVDQVAKRVTRGWEQRCTRIDLRPVDALQLATGHASTDPALCTGSHVVVIRSPVTVIVHHVTVVVHRECRRVRGHARDAGARPIARLGTIAVIIVVTRCAGLKRELHDAKLRNAHRVRARAAIVGVERVAHALPRCIAGFRAVAGVAIQARHTHLRRVKHTHVRIAPILGARVAIVDVGTFGAAFRLPRVSHVAHGNLNGIQRPRRERTDGTGREREHKRPAGMRETIAVVIHAAQHWTGAHIDHIDAERTGERRILSRQLVGKCLIPEAVGETGMRYNLAVGKQLPRLPVPGPKHMRVECHANTCVVGQVVQHQGRRCPAIQGPKNRAPTEHQFVGRDDEPGRGGPEAIVEGFEVLVVGLRANHYDGGLWLHLGNSLGCRKHRVSRGRVLDPSTGVLCAVDHHTNVEDAFLQLCRLLNALRRANLARGVEDIRGKGTGRDRMGRKVEIDERANVLSGKVVEK